MLAESQMSATGSNRLRMVLDGPAASMPRPVQEHAQDVQLLRTVSKIGEKMMHEGGVGRASRQGRQLSKRASTCI